MKRIFLTAMAVMLLATTGCTSALTHGDRTSDDTHAFLLLSSQTIGKIDETVAADETTFLVIKYEVENLQSKDDTERLWTDQIEVAADEEYYDPTLIESLNGQLWETSLLKNEKQSGYMAFIVPEEISDFTLTVTFPTSQTEESYDFRPVDKRVSVNVDYVYTRLEQIARTRRIVLIGGMLSALSSAPIRYLGVILVPEDEIDGLLEDTDGLDEEAKRVVIEEHLIKAGHCRLE